MEIAKARAPPKRNLGFMAGQGNGMSRAAAACITALPLKERQRMRYIVIAYEIEDSPEATAAYMERRRKWRQREKHRRQRRLYFLKQRLCGVALIALTVFLTSLLDGDATAAVLLIPMGLFLIFTKEMCITNEFYWKEQERKEKKCYRY